MQRFVKLLLCLINCYFGILSKGIMILYVCKATVDNKRKKSTMKTFGMIDAENIANLTSLKVRRCWDPKIQLINLSIMEKC